MDDQPELLEVLFRSLNERQRPEDIAHLILRRCTNLSDDETQALRKAVSIRNTASNWFTSMLTTFQEPHGMRKQLEKAQELFQKTFSEDESDFIDTAKVEQFLENLNALIGKTVGKSDFKNDRLNSEARKKKRLDMSRRRYNKLFRHLGRLEAKLKTLIREQQKLRFTKISKASLVSELEWLDFSKDMHTACFIAYYAAKSYKRSVFTAYGQEKAYDEIADALYRGAINGGSANWFAIAHVYPKQEVIDHLTPEQKGALLGKWTSILEGIAGLLEETWDKSNINRETMVVRRGNDSSTWNQAAGAWNKARDNWVTLVYSLGMEDILHKVCFGKVMRLMAADVVAWHRIVGGDIDPNTKIWNELPLPWQVFNREAECSIDEVRNICQKYGVDTEKSGWVTPRPHTHVAQYKPTPELVHGVTVESPFLAKILRDAGYFSGKEKKIQEDW